MAVTFAHFDDESGRPEPDHCKFRSVLVTDHAFESEATRQAGICDKERPPVPDVLPDKLAHRVVRGIAGLCQSVKMANRAQADLVQRANKPPIERELLRQMNAADWALACNLGPQIARGLSWWRDSPAARNYRLRAEVHFDTWAVRPHRSDKVPTIVNRWQFAATTTYARIQELKIKLICEPLVEYPECIVAGPADRPRWQDRGGVSSKRGWPEMLIRRRAVRVKTPNAQNSIHGDSISRRPKHRSVPNNAIGAGTPAKTRRASKQV